MENERLAETGRRRPEQRVEVGTPWLVEPREGVCDGVASARQVLREVHMVHALRQVQGQLPHDRVDGGRRGPEPERRAERGH